MKSIAIYVRTSTTKQVKGSDAQFRAIKRYLESQDIETERVKLFKDEGYTGRNIKRPQFQMMMNEIEKGAIESVICYSFSRISRSIKDLTSIIEIFEQYNVKFKSLSESVDTETATGRCFLHILASLSTLELEQIKERTINGLQAAKERGVLLGRPKQRNSELIQELHSKGYTYEKIARLTGVSISTVWREIRGISQKAS